MMSAKSDLAPLTKDGGSQKHRALPGSPAVRHVALAGHSLGPTGRAETRAIPVQRARVGPAPSGLVALRESRTVRSWHLLDPKLLAVGGPTTVP